MTKVLPRGIRNNNPLNIRKNQNRWKGLARRQTDRSFFQFKEMKWGYRAAFIILKRYYNDYHLLTIEDIIRRWAPPNENNSKAYANYVATMCATRVDRILPSPMQDPMAENCPRDGRV